MKSVGELRGGWSGGGRSHAYMLVNEVHGACCKRVGGGVGGPKRWQCMMLWM